MKARRRWTKAVDAGAVTASQAARGGFVWVAAGGLASRSLKDRSVLLETTVSTWAASGLARATSHLTKRSRPCSSGRPSLLKCPESPSFPSEHSAAAFAAALTLSRIAPALRPILLPAATLVALSRLRVGVHYPTDVMGGALTGALVSRTVSTYVKRT